MESVCLMIMLSTCVTYLRYAVPFTPTHSTFITPILAHHHTHTRVSSHPYSTPTLITPTLITPTLITPILAYHHTHTPHPHSSHQHSSHPHSLHPYSHIITPTLITHPEHRWQLATHHYQGDGHSHQQGTPWTAAVKVKVL